MRVAELVSPEAPSTGLGSRLGGSFADVVLRTWNDNMLFTVMVELTYRCNLDCVFCYNDLGLEGRNLSTEQYLRLFEDLRRMEVMNLVLTGGEPLAHPDFLVLGRKARELGFVLRIKSNGHALRGALARRIKDEVDPYVVDLSIHGDRAETHDRQTRVPGSFERLMANIPELQEIGLRLKLNCTMTSWNEGEVEGIFAIADRFGLQLGMSPTVSPRDDGDRSPLSLAPSREGKRRLFELLDRRSRQAEKMRVELQPHEDDAVPRPTTGKNCGAGSSTVTVDPYGNVFPCVQWRRGLGNLHEKPIHEIWGGSETLTEVRDLTGKALEMVKSHGPQGRLMNFCPGLAELDSGDPTRAYAGGLEDMELLSGVQARAAAGHPSLPVIS